MKFRVLDKKENKYSTHFITGAITVVNFFKKENLMLHEKMHAMHLKVHQLLDREKQ